jgi:pimeloyl-ACP methyl ester carboxylesterase
MAFVQTPRGRFFYEEQGSAGPVVYLLHGLTSNHLTWDKITGPLAAAGFHLFVFDMRGHGKSDWPDSGYEPEDHGKDVAACAEALGHSRLHVVGHSTGGRNALTFAGLYPEKTITLTIIDQTLIADSDSWKKYHKRYGEYPVPFADEERLDEFLSLKFPGDPRRFAYYKSQFEAKENGHWSWNFSTQAAWETQRLGRVKDSFDLLAKVKCPALFIKGADSDYVSMEEARKIEKWLPQGRLAVVERAEHAVQRDNPEGFLGVLIPFLRGN